MARKRKKRRQQHGSAWHWKQTDSWYYTESGTKKRVPMFDEDGQRIRGKENKEAARLASARIKGSSESCVLRESYYVLVDFSGISPVSNETCTIVAILDTLHLLGETESGSAGTQQSQGISRSPVRQGCI